MKVAPAVKPALYGAAFGAVATAVIGFNYGGWHTATSAERLALDRSDGAVIEALVPICLAQSKLDPDATAKIATIAGMVTGYERRDYVMKAGWATTPSADAPNRDVAAACAEALLQSVQG